MAFLAFALFADHAVSLALQDTFMGTSMLSIKFIATSTYLSAGVLFLTATSLLESTARFPRLVGTVSVMMLSRYDSDCRSCSTLLYFLQSRLLT